VVYGSRASELTLWNIACIHEGNIGCEHNRLYRLVNCIKDSGSDLFFGGGDWGEAIDVTDKRYDGKSADMTADELSEVGQAQCDRLVKIFGPVSNQCFGAMEGNHEYKYFLKNKYRIIKAVAKGLGVPFLGYSAFFDIVFIRNPKFARRHPLRFYDEPPVSADGGRTAVRIMAHHGASSARTMGAQVSFLERLALRYHADVVFAAHAHNLHVLPIVELGADRSCKNLQEKTKWALMSGSYLKTFAEGDGAGYGERAAYAPAFLGSVGITIRPATREMKPELPWMGF